jgi:hypothetical protein
MATSDLGAATFLGRARKPPPPRRSFAPRPSGPDNPRRMAFEVRVPCPTCRVEGARVEMWDAGDALLEPRPCRLCSAAGPGDAAAGLPRTPPIAPAPWPSGPSRRAWPRPRRLTAARPR